jgi:hypothetical protein
MIRPITMICWILALSAGLYLYRAKHEVELMDKHIDQIAKDTNNLRVESRRLMDDWIRLGEPEQLRKYSDQYLGLKAVAPTQFVRLTDLPNRLPTPRADPIDTPVEPEDQTPVAQYDPQAGEANSVNEAAADDLPVPPIPPTALVQAQTVQSSTVQSSTAQPPAPQPVAVSIPLQARPVTPRPPAEQQEQEAIRPRPTAEPRLAEEPHAPPAKLIEPKPVPMRLAEPRQAAPIQGSSVQAAAQVTPPLRSAPLPVTSGRVQAQELPPLQAQGGGQWGNPPPRPVESHIADPGGYDRQQAARPAQVRSFGPPPGQGSLLGMQRGGVPAPLPAPTPVSASWTNSIGH